MELDGGNLALAAVCLNAVATDRGSCHFGNGCGIHIRMGMRI